MGCISSTGGGHNKMNRTKSTSARKDLKYFKQRDMKQTAPLFLCLDIDRSLQKHLYTSYESICENGKGSFNALLEEFRINKCDRLFFERTYQYFNPRHKVFTFPQYVICTWNLLSLHPRALAEWTFRAYFGGDKCHPNKHASCDEVFHFMDIIYGISKEMDYNPNSESRPIGYTGNSHDFDVKRAHKLVKTIAQNNVVGISEFIELTKKSPVLLNRVFAAQLRMRVQMKGVAYWEKISHKRQGVSDFDSAIVRILKTDEAIFDMKPHQQEVGLAEAEARKKKHEQHVQAVKNIREGHAHFHPKTEGEHHKTKMSGYKNKNRKPSKYVAIVGHEEYTGSAHAEGHHHHAATKIQKILSRGHKGRHAMRSHRAKKKRNLSE